MYYRIPASSYVGDRPGYGQDEFRLASDPYSERGSIGMSDTDNGTFGLSVELSRNLFHDAEYGYGVDLAFAVNWFFKQDYFKSSGRMGEGSVDTIFDMGDIAHDDDFNRYTDGDGDYYGSGGYEALDWGTPVSVDPDLDMRYVDMPGGGGRYSARGDYSDLEMILLARPYYDIYDWLRLTGTIGLAVSRMDFDFSMAMTSNGRSMRYSDDSHQWDVYGIAGLGLMMYYKDFTLSCDVLARFLDDKMDIDNPYVHGSVSRGDWMVRAMIGYEF